MPSAISRLFQSRKFLVLLADAIFSVVALCLTQYLNPDLVKFVLALLTILQPVVYAYIDGTTKEDVAAKQNGTFKGEFK